MFDRESSPGIQYLISPNPWGEAWAYLSSEHANIFVTNHDTERDGSSLNNRSPNNAYVLATIFMLGWNYALPTVFSGFDFVNFNQGAPQDGQTGLTQAVTCYQGGWRCEHRWLAFANMAFLRKRAASLKVSRTKVGNANQIGEWALLGLLWAWRPFGKICSLSSEYRHGFTLAWAREGIAYVAINNDWSTWSTTFDTGLKPGSCEAPHEITAQH